MSTIIRSALVALVLTSASAAMARPGDFVDQSRPDGGYAPNSQEGVRAFWDYQSRRGGN